MLVKYSGKNIEAVTAAKIQMVYENEAKVFVPRTPMAKAMKRPINTGPADAVFPVTAKKIDARRHNKAMPRAIE